MTMMGTLASPHRRLRVRLLDRGEGCYHDRLVGSTLLDLNLLLAAKSLLVAMCANPTASDATCLQGRKHLFVKLGVCSAVFVG